MRPFSEIPLNRNSGDTIIQLITTAIFTLLAVGNAVAQQSSEAAKGEEFFTQQIVPILEQRCFGCHSHAAGEMEGGLTLDSRTGWSNGGSRGSAVIPGKADESLLIRAVRREDAELSMPPEEKLLKREVDLLVEWVERGAADPRETKSTNAPHPIDWWSLQPLHQPDVPVSPPRDGLNLNPIDAFIQQQLLASKITAVPKTDRRTLIRRVTFDLHGLPPTPEAVAEFIADPDPQAYERLLDSLLNSPRYGERWARHWLDSVHFADSHGCEHDVLRPDAWRYRDYVIQSFNQDTPWSRFIREQLAADHFYPNESHLTAALGFVAAGPLELSRASTAPVTFDYLDRDDIVTQTMAAFASTTANCARCHHHKFDPITQEDYYSLQAVFAGVGKGAVEFDTAPAVAAERRRWTNLIAQAKSGHLPDQLDESLSEIVRRYEDGIGSPAAVWQPLSPATFLSSNGTTLTRLDDDSLLASGDRPEKDTYTITAATSLSALTALRLDVLSDDRLPMKGPGRQDNGNLHLSEIEILVKDADGESPLSITKVVADWDQSGWTIAHSIDGNVQTAWGIYPKVGESHHAVFELQAAHALSPNSRIVVVLKQLHGGGHLIGRLKLYATDAAGATAEVLPEPVRVALELPTDQRTVEHQNAIGTYALIAHAEQQLANLPAMSTAYAVSNLYSHGKKLDQPAAPKIVHVLKRGDIEKPGAVAQPGSLSAINVLPGRFQQTDASDEPSRRAALADWLAAAENPLTWRSAVNRVWSYHFGQGICDTVNDFGRMGSLPSHPELLDWLAVWFRDEADGSLKQLHRMILLSSTYQRQSRSVSSSGQTHDNGNRLLWRMNRRQLDAESFRDAVLQISGRLDLTMGGPGIQQFTKVGEHQLTPILDYDAFDWNASNAARRSIYRVVWRGIADPFMESLDFPDLGLLAPKRGSSVSALQALALYNNDFVLHHCRVLADRLSSEHATVNDQVAMAVRLIYLREPRESELAAITEFCNQHGLAATCRVLFNSNEFIFVD